MTGATNVARQGRSNDGNVVDGAATDGMGARYPMKPTPSVASTLVTKNVRSSGGSVDGCAVGTKMDRRAAKEPNEAPETFVNKLSMSRSRTDSSNRTAATVPLSVCSSASQDPSASSVHVRALDRDEERQQQRQDDCDDGQSIGGYVTMDEARAEAASLYSGNGWKKTARTDDDDAQSIIAAAMNTGRTRRSSNRSCRGAVCAGLSFPPADDASTASSEQTLLSRMLFSCGVTPTASDLKDANDLYQESIETFHKGLEQVAGVSKTWLRTSSFNRKPYKARRTISLSSSASFVSSATFSSTDSESSVSSSGSAAQSWWSSGNRSWASSGSQRRSRNTAPSVSSRSVLSSMPATIHENDDRSFGPSLSSSSSSSSCDESTSSKRSNTSRICKEDNYVYTEDDSVSYEDLSASSSRLQKRNKHKTRRMLV